MDLLAPFLDKKRKHPLIKEVSFLKQVQLGYSN